MARAPIYTETNAKLLHLGGGFTTGLSLLLFSTSVPELKRHLNTLRWAWWAQCCSCIQRCVMKCICHVTSSALFFFSEFFDCFWISEAKLHISSWKRGSSHLGEFGNELQMCSKTTHQRFPLQVSCIFQCKFWRCSQKQRTPAGKLH